MTTRLQRAKVELNERKRSVAELVDARDVRERPIGTASGSPRPEGEVGGYTDIHWTVDASRINRVRAGSSPAAATI